MIFRFETSAALESSIGKLRPGAVDFADLAAEEGAPDSWDYRAQRKNPSKMIDSQISTKDCDVAFHPEASPLCC